MSDSDSTRPFADVKVVEFGQFIAVPFCAQLMAEGGAQVLKIEALAGDPTRHIAQLAPDETRTFVSRNRGKRSLPLQLSDPAARPVIERLLAWADVVLLNFRPGLAQKLGLDGESLAQRLPRLVIGTVTAFGRRGPDAGFAGMDIVVQARTGLMAANGRMQDGRPASGDPVVADYMCAMSLAFGVSAALLRRERTGRGGVVDTSLMQAAMTLANNQLVRSEAADAGNHAKALQRLAELRARGASFEEQANTLPSARSLPFMKVYFRTYATSDGYIALACGSQRLRERFMQVLGMVDDGLHAIGDSSLQSHYDKLQHDVEVLLRSESTQHWLTQLNEAGVPVSPVRFPLELFDDEHVAANGMLHALEHPSIGPMTVVAPPVQLDGGGFQPAPASKAFASETRAILTELGFAADEVDELVRAEVTRVRAPDG